MKKPATAPTMDLFSSTDERADGARAGAKSVEQGSPRLSTLFSAAETARTSAWRAVERGDWAAARDEAERAAESYHVIAALAAEELVR